MAQKTKKYGNQVMKLYVYHCNVIPTPFQNMIDVNISGKDMRCSALLVTLPPCFIEMDGIGKAMSYPVFQ
jgi:hypothetical protein